MLTVLSNCPFSLDGIFVHAAEDKITSGKQTKTIAAFVCKNRYN